MSRRAISRWLKETEGIKLSAATVAKALREPGKYRDEWHDPIEPAARKFAETHQADPESVLSDENCFESLCNDVPSVHGETTQEQGEDHERYQQAEAVLRRRWFAFDADARSACLSHVEESTRAENE
jgi:hypothetical protein